MSNIDIDNVASRYLGFWESACKFAHNFLHGTGNVVAFSEISGKINPEILRQAITLLYHRHPLLRASIKEGIEGAFFSLNTSFGDISLSFIERTSDRQWREVVEEEMDRRFVSKHSLWRLTLLHGADKSELIITAHHAIADGLSLSTLTEQLLTSYHQLSERAETTPTDLHLPQTTESLPLYDHVENLLEKTNSWDEYVHFQKAIAQERVDKILFHQHVPLAKRSNHNLYRTINSTQLEQLLTESRKHGVTLNSTLNASMLLTYAKLCDAPFSTALKTPVDLRKYCNPPIDHDQLGCYISMVKTIHQDINKNMNLWDLAQAYQKQLAVRIPQLGFLPTDFNLIELDLKTIASIFGMEGTKRRNYFSEGFGISNLGRLNLKERYGPLHLRSFRFCTNRRMGDFLFFTNVTTVHHQMMLTFTYAEPLISKPFAEKFVELYFETLLDL